ncbi:MAG: hypothetical protein WBI53_01705 [Paludibacter sp.]
MCYSLNAPIAEGNILTSGIEPTESEDVFVDGTDYCGNFEYYLGSYFDNSPVYYNYLEKIYNSEGYVPPGSWNPNNYYFPPAAARLYRVASQKKYSNSKE